MSFTEAIQHVFSNYAKFDGRARRSEYWYFTLFNVIINVVLNLLASTTGSNIVTVLSGIFALAVLVPGLAVFWRRMHDIGKSGAYFLLNLIPLVGGIILLVFLCKDSDPGENQYGPNPKGATY